MYHSKYSSEEKNSKKIYLVDQTTWLPWINIIKAKATRGSLEDVWQYIDPSKTIQPELPASPQEPHPSDVKSAATSILDLDSVEFAKFQYLEKRYTNKINHNKNLMNSIREIDSYIMSSIELDNELWTRDVTSTWALLRALQKRLAPTIHSKRNEIIRSYNSLKIYDSNQPVERFLYEWERVYGLAVSINLPDVLEERPLYDFALALHTIDESYAINLELTIDENLRQRSVDPTVKIIRLEDAIEEFRNYYNRHRDLHQKISPASFTASKSDPRKEQRNCVCGNFHSFKECYYLNPHLRPSGWVGKDSIYHQINEALADPRRIKIRTLIKKTTNYDGDSKVAEDIVKKKSDDNPLSNAILYEPTTEELQNPFRQNPLNFAALAATESASLLKNSWILDGGSDIHICNDAKKWNFEITKRASKNDFIRAGNTTIPIEAYGSMKLQVDTLSGKRHITLKNVALSHDFLTNIVSMQLLNKSGFHWSSRRPTNLEFEDYSHACTLYQDGGHILFNNPLKSTSMATVLLARLTYNPKLRTVTEAKLHRLIAHASPEVISHINGPDYGVNIDKTKQSPSTSQCVHCSLAKSKNIISRKTGSEIARSGEIFHTLCWDAIIMEEAYNGDKYVSHFHCPDSHFNFCFSCKSKKDFKLTVRTVIQIIKTQWNKTVCVIRMDGETSLIQEHQKLAMELGIICRISAPDTPEQNGSAERSGGVLMTKARAMALEALLPSNLWPETVICASYITNRTPVCQLGWKTPFEIVHGSKPSYAHLHIFGCRAYALDKHVAKTNKLSPRAHIGHLVGYDSTNIFRVWVPSKNKVIRTRDVTFDEDTFYDPKDLDIGAVLRESAENILNLLEMPEWEELESENENDIEIINSVPSNPQYDRDIKSDPSSSGDWKFSSTEISKLKKCSSNSSLKSLQKDESSSDINYPKAIIKNIASKKINGNIDENNIIEGKRRRKPVNYSSFHDSFAAAKDSVKPDRLHRRDLPPPPKNHREVLQHQYSAGFKTAEMKEFNTLLDKKLCTKICSQQIFEMKNEGILNSSEKPLPLMWVYTYKFDADGYLLSFKAQLVARGDLQNSTQETYATTLAAQVFRAIIAISAVHGLKIRQYDIVAAYTNADLKQPIIAHLPEGFQKRENFLLIKKALYGLPESALLWQNHLQATLVEIGLSPVPGVNCLFSNKYLTVLFYVDDIIVTYHERNLSKVEHFEQKLMEKYETKPLGQIHHFLGIRVVKKEQERKIWLVQESYMEYMAKEFQIDQNDVRNISTPLPMIPLQQNTGHATAREIHRYQQQVGKLNYPAVITRPDIAFGVSKLSEFLQNPSKDHVEAANHMMKYLIGSKFRGIEYDGNTINIPGRTFIASSDASFADDPETRYSSSGFCFQLFNGMIHWKATKQKTVATSSTEAELLALTITAKEYLWWTRLFQNLNLEIESPVIFCDNQQTLRLLKKETPKLATRLKHVDIHQCWLRQEVQCGRITVDWIESNKMIADGFTKILPAQRHRIFVQQMNLVDLDITSN